VSQSQSFSFVVFIRIHATPSTIFLIRHFYVRTHRRTRTGTAIRTR
jgi:hypothetical protein